MVKMRNFYVGIGTGLIVSGIVTFFYMNFLYSPNEKNGQLENQETNQMSVEQIKKIASESNLIVLTNKELEEITDNVKEQAEKAIYFAVSQGMNSSDIADLLFEANIIKDKQLFTGLLEKYDLTKKIRAGVYLYSQSMTIEQVIEEITRTSQKNW